MLNAIIFSSDLQQLLLVSACLPALYLLKIRSYKWLFLLLSPLLFVSKEPVNRIHINAVLVDPDQVKNKWKQLFNNKDFSGWETHLSKPHPSSIVVGMPKDNKGNYMQAIGHNNDPLKVFTVVSEDGVPAIRISGQVFGCVVTKESFSNFHLRLQFKWGKKKWPPRENDVRDSGVLYFSVGKPGEGSENWLVSQECQVQEGDCGDFWQVGSTAIDIPARTNNKGQYVYDPAGSLVHFGKNVPAGPRCWKSPDNEKASGEWNTIEVYCFNGNSVHVINGAVVMRLFNSKIIKDGKEEPLLNGKIQLQSEGAEIFYRNVELSQLSKMPPLMKQYKK